MQRIESTDSGVSDGLKQPIVLSRSSKNQVRTLFKVNREHSLNKNEH